jgi:hypothetical protein
VIGTERKEYPTPPVELRPPKCRSPTRPSSISRRATALRGYRLIGLLAVEIYQTTCVNVDDGLNQADIYLPIRS